MKPIVITMVGKDKAGLVDSLAKHIYAQGGNWLASNFALMAGQFAGFVEVHIPQEKHDTLIKSLDALEGISVQSVVAGDLENQAPSDSLVINVMGNDKPGIVQEITAILHQFNLSIVSMDSCCESAPNWGSLMFKANIVIDVPVGFDKDTIAEALESVANDLVVDISTYS
ncbi:glycine cleavage system protein R [Alteromonas sediminis]|uniref:Glycine cleavage system transcriptional repressor n=1 Tax=Alteromonas sediminis TaxID=2259342 RepID=A0A3N5Y4P4_9ALTE|nr:ACT domain-containing protein [Alteromonas sediminis]RPJ68133.1 glycine cleavage system protein R [Alteromonas sediminis]